MQNTVTMPYQFRIDMRQFLNLAVIVLIACLMFMPEFAHATTSKGTSPFSTTELAIPGAAAGSSWVVKFGAVIKLVIFLILIIAIGLGLGDSVFTIFGSIREAVKTNQWGDMFKIVGAVLVAVIIAIVLTQVAYDYAIAPLDTYFKAAPAKP